MPLVRVLGPVDVVNDAGVVRRPGSPLRRTILALLALEAGRVVSADQLLEQAWDGNPPESGLRALRFHISKLRADLAVADLIVTVASGYRLDADTDLARLDAPLDGCTVEELGAMLSMWRGDPFHDASQCIVLDREWERIGQRRLTITETLNRYRVDRGDTTGITDLDRLCLEHPLRESLWSLRATAHYAAGDPAEALRTIAQLRTNLREELGVDPTPDVDRLEHQILDHTLPTGNFVPDHTGEPPKALGRDNEVDREVDFVDPERPNRFVRPPVGQLQPGNLPVRIRRLVGRDDDVAAVLDRLDDRGIVTVVGVGGIGKTRLVLACAAQRRRDYEHGVWMCELASVAEPAAVASAVAQAIGARQHPGRSMVDSVAEYCRRRRMLLVLDNCEHVLDAAGDLVEALLEVAPGVDVLATSREPLGVDGEQIHPLPSLPSDGAQSPAVELFIQRADDAAAVLTWSAADVETIQRICTRLDGIPLAIELAAARVRSLGLVEIEQHLHRALRVLRGSRRSVERHRNLEAAIDGSYQALNEPDRVMFDRLSVFTGGFDLAAATAVCSDGELVDSDDVIDLLDDLVAKSLIVPERIASTTRFRMLEPVRQYAQNRLNADGNGDQVHQRHLDHYVEWAEQWRNEIPITGLSWRHRLEREFPNLRTAFNWAAATDGTESAARIVTALGIAQRYLQMFEIGDWAERILDMPGIDDLPQGPGIVALAIMQRWWQTDLPGLREHLDRAEQMRAIKLDADSPQQSLHLANVKEFRARNNGDPRAAVDAYDHVDRRDPIIDADVAWLRLAWPSAVLDADWARPVMNAERRILDHRTSVTGSALIAAMRHHRRAHDALYERNYRAAADEARRGLAAALDVGATYFVHFNVGILTQSLSLSGDDAIDDLERIAQTLIEQRDVGQISDQWLLLTGTAGILHRHGQEQLAHDVLRGMRSSVWNRRTPATTNLAEVLGVSVDDPLDTGATPDRDDLVDRTLAAIDELLAQART